MGKMFQESWKNTLLQLLKLNRQTQANQPREAKKRRLQFNSRVGWCSEALTIKLIRSELDKSTLLSFRVDLKINFEEADIFFSQNIVGVCSLQVSDAHLLAIAVARLIASLMGRRLGAPGRRLWLHKTGGRLLVQSVRCLPTEVLRREVAFVRRTVGRWRIVRGAVVRVRVSVTLLHWLDCLDLLGGATMGWRNVLFCCSLHHLYVK